MSERLARSQIVAIDGLVVCMCDRLSPVNRASLHAAAWASTTPGGALQLWEYNTLLVRHMDAGEGVFWILVLCGVFRIQVQVHSTPATLPESTEYALLGHRKAARISCPSGELGILDVELAHRVGWTPLATVSPGEYEVRLTIDPEQEHRHILLQAPADYPPSDGADFVLHLARCM